MVDPVEKRVLVQFLKFALLLSPLAFLYIAMMERNALHIPTKDDFWRILNEADVVKKAESPKILQSSESSSTCKEYEISREISKWKENKEIVPTRPPILSFRTWQNGTLGQCRIPKSMHTVIEYVFGYLSNPIACNLTGGFKMDAALSRCQYHLSGQKPEVFRTKGYTPFAVIRDPLNRFLSGWLDKCIWRLKGDIGYNGENRRSLHPLCYDCGRDLECFIKENYKSLYGQSAAEPSNRTTAYFGGQDHYFPWNWHCRSYDGLVLQYLKFDRSPKMLEEFAQLLREHKVDEEKINFVISKISSTETVHKTFNSDAWKEAINLLSRRDDLYKMILKTFYYDYMETGLFPIYPNFKCWRDNNEELKASGYKNEN